MFSAVIGCLFALLVAGRLRAARLGLRARREFLHSSVVLEDMELDQLARYFHQLVRERGYRDVRTVTAAGDDLEIVGTSPGGWPAIFRWLPPASYGVGSALEQLQRSAVGYFGKPDLYLVTVAAASQETVELAASRGVTVIDRRTIDAWVAEARGTRFAEGADPGVIPPDVINHVQEGRKLEAIALYRRLNPKTGIREAKDVIDRIAAVGQAPGHLRSSGRR